MERIANQNTIESKGANRFSYLILLNIECGKEVLDEINTAFRFNDAVVRNLIMSRKKADIEESPIMKLENESREKKENEPVTESPAESPAEPVSPDESLEDKNLDDDVEKAIGE